MCLGCVRAGREDGVARHGRDIANARVPLAPVRVPLCVRACVCVCDVGPCAVVCVAAGQRGV